MNEEIEVLKKHLHLIAGIGILLLVLILSGLGFVIYKHNKTIEQNQEIATHMIEQKQLGDNIVRSQHQYVTKDDLDAVAKSQNINMKVISDDLKNLQAKPVAINQVQIATPGTYVKAIKSTIVSPANIPIPVTISNGVPLYPDPYGYLKNTQTLSMDEKFKETTIPFGSSSFSSWRENPWDLTIYPRQYQLSTVIGMDKNQNTYTYNRFSVLVNGKEYPADITISSTKQELPEPSFYFHPKVFLGIDAGYLFAQRAVDLVPNLSIGFFSYGKYVTNPDYQLGMIGLGFSSKNERPIITFTPVLYNIGQNISWLSNSYLGVSIGMDTSTNFSLLGGFKVGL